jgi:hypothetical protein
VIAGDPHLDEMPPGLLQKVHRSLDLRHDLERMRFHIPEDAPQNVRHAIPARARIGEQLEPHRAGTRISAFACSGVRA